MRGSCARTAADKQAPHKVSFTFHLGASFGAHSALHWDPLGSINASRRPGPIAGRAGFLPRRHRCRCRREPQTVREPEPQKALAPVRPPLREPATVRPGGRHPAAGGLALAAGSAAAGRGRPTTRAPDHGRRRASNRGRRHTSRRSRAHSRWGRCHRRLPVRTARSNSRCPLRRRNTNCRRCRRCCRDTPHSLPRSARRRPPRFATRCCADPLRALARHSSDCRMGYFSNAGYTWLHKTQGRCAFDHKPRPSVVERRSVFVSGSFRTAFLRNRCAATCACTARAHAFAWGRTPRASLPHDAIRARSFIGARPTT